MDKICPYAAIVDRTFANAHYHAIIWQRRDLQLVNPF